MILFTRINPYHKRRPDGFLIFQVIGRAKLRSYITEREAQMVLDALASMMSARAAAEGESTSVPEAALYDIGVFYLLSLEPEHDPTRFKVGFASNLNERFRQHRCSAPFAKVVKIWPCRRLWEKTAIECVTDGCEQLHTESIGLSLWKQSRPNAVSFFRLCRSW
jgi:hypothetical protein